MDHGPVAEHLPYLGDVLRDRLKRLDVDLVFVPAVLELLLFEPLFDLIRRSLVRHPIFLDEHPEIDVAPPVRFAPRDTTVQNDPDHAVEFAAEFGCCRSHRFLELGLRNL